MPPNDLQDTNLQQHHWRLAPYKGVGYAWLLCSFRICNALWLHHQATPLVVVAEMVRMCRMEEWESAQKGWSCLAHGVVLVLALWAGYTLGEWHLE